MSHSIITNTPVKLSDGSEVFFEMSSNNIEQEVGIGASYSFKKVKKSINALVSELNDIMKEAKPNKFQVEFGVEVSLDNEGTLSALIVQGSSKANIKVTLAWEDKASN